MFETDAEYLRKNKERYKLRGLKIDNKDVILKKRWKTLKSLCIISIVISIVYSFAIGFALGIGG